MASHELGSPAVQTPPANPSVEDLPDDVEQGLLHDFRGALSSSADPAAAALQLGGHAPRRAHVHHGHHDGGHRPHPSLSFNTYRRSTTEEFAELIANHKHYSHRSAWIRAFVLGALDGLVSVACTIVGVSAGSGGSLSLMRLAGVSAWVACALGMAAGEYVSVASQKDCEEADIRQEREAQAKGDHYRAYELKELAQIYVERGLTPELAKQVAEEMTAYDAVKTHARDELGINVDELSNPLQAAVVSAIACTFGAAIPLIAGAFVKHDLARIISVVVSTAVGCLLTGVSLRRPARGEQRIGVVVSTAVGGLLFGVVASAMGGAGYVRGGLRVLIGGCLSMGMTYGVGRLFGVAVE